MGEQFTRRQVLTLLAEAGALAALGGLGCFRARPTRPSKIFSPGKGEAIALGNAVVVDVEKGNLIQGKSVLIRDGVIEGIFDSGAQGLSHIKTLDCQGCYLIPGLINAHCHITIPSITNVSMWEIGMIREQIMRNYEDAICWGITTVRDMGAIPKIIAKDREYIERGELLGPHILTPLSIISVPNGYPDFVANVNFIARMMTGQFCLRAETPEQARDFVKQLRDQGADFVKIAFDHRSFIYGRDALNVFSDAQVEAIKDEAEKLEMRIAAHHLYSVGLDRGLKFGMNSMEHVVSDVDLTDEQVQKILDTKTPFVPTATVGISMAFKSEGDPYNDDPVLNESLKWKQDVQLKELPRHCIPEIYKKSLELVRYYENGEYALEKNKKVVSYNPKVATRGLVVGSRNLKRLIKEGAILGAGNDAGVALTFPGMLHFEMDFLNRFGMTEAQTLRAATIVNARICGIESKCGSITQGKRADLVLLGDNPFASVSNVAKVRAVFKGGALVCKAEEFALNI